MRGVQQGLRIGQSGHRESPGASEAGAPSGGGASCSEGEEGTEAGFGEGVGGGEGVEEVEEGALTGRELGWEEMLEEVLEGFARVLALGLVMEGVCFHRGEDTLWVREWDGVGEIAGCFGDVNSTFEPLARGGHGGLFASERACVNHVCEQV